MNTNTLSSSKFAAIRNFLVAVVVSLAAPATETSAEEIAVIGNSGNSIAALEKSDVARIFLGRLKKFPGGERAVPVIGGESSATRIAFEKAVLGKSESQMKAYWAKQMFSGKGRPPESVGSDAEILSRVAANVDAIGYIPLSMVDSSVKVVYKQ